MDYTLANVWQAFYDSAAPTTARHNMAPTCPISPPVYHCPYRPPEKPTTAILRPNFRVSALNNRIAVMKSKRPNNRFI